MEKKSIIRGIELRTKADPLDLSESELQLYAPLGFAVTQLAALEFSMDEFVLGISTRDPELCFRISTIYPAGYVAKIDFIIDAFILLPKLREIGDWDGKLDLNHLAYGLEEIFSFRNVCIHGRLSGGVKKKNTMEYRVKKYTRVKGEKGAFQISSWSFTHHYLVRILHLASYFRAMLDGALRLLDGEDRRAEQDELRRSRSRVRQLFEEYPQIAEGRTALWNV